MPFDKDNFWNCSKVIFMSTFGLSLKGGVDIKVFFFFFSSVSGVSELLINRESETRGTVYTETTP